MPVPGAAVRGLRPDRRLGARSAFTLGGGVMGGYLSALVLLPIAAVIAQAGGGGAHSLWQAVSSPEAVAAIGLSLASASIVACVNAVLGTLTAWVLVRDSFPGRWLLDAVIDLPFALPTIVAGLVLLTLYGKSGPTGIDVTFTRTAVVVALLFVTLPFVVRSVQPVLRELDRSMEEAAHSLGASASRTFTAIVLPSLLPAIFSGASLSFARALGEYGSIVLISGNLPFKTEVGSVYIAGQVSNSDLPTAAAVSVVLLALAVLVLGASALAARYRSRHAR